MPESCLSLSSTRTIVFGIVTAFSVIELALSAHLISLTEPFEFYFTFSAFALAVSLISLLTVPTMFIIDLKRRGAFTSQILVELIWLGVLWVLWLASAADSASSVGGADCTSDALFVPSWFVSGCNEAKAITAFGWLTWAALTGYLVYLLTVSIVASNKGTPIWKSSVRDAKTVTVTVDLVGEPKVPIAQQNYQVPVLPQTYPPPQAAAPVATYPGTATV